MKNLGLLDAVRRPFGLVLAVMLAVLATAAPAWAADGAASGGAEPFKFKVFWALAFVGSLAALFYARKFFNMVMEADEGNDEMKEIAGYVRDGAWAYLKQQYKVVAVFFAVICALLAFMAFGLHVQSGWVPFAFITGGFCSPVWLASLRDEVLLRWRVTEQPLAAAEVAEPGPPGRLPLRCGHGPDGRGPGPASISPCGSWLPVLGLADVWLWVAYAR